MNRKIEIARNIAAELLNYLLIASIAYVFVADFAKLKPPVGELFALALLPVFFYILRERCDRLWLFLALHGAVPVLFGLLYPGRGVYRVILLAVIWIYVFLSIGRRVQSRARGMEAVFPPAAIGIYFVLYLLDSVQGSGENKGQLLQLMICFAAGYFMYYFLRQFLSYVDVNARTTENIPVKNVFHSSVGLATGFTVAAFCMITVCANRSFIEKISAGFKKLIRKLLSLIQIGSREINIEPEVTPQPEGAGFPDLGEAAEPSLFMQILDMLLIVATLGLILVLISYGVIVLVRAVKEGFRAKGYKHKYEETEYQDCIERIYQKDSKEIKQRRSLGERWKAALSPEERMRRIYKKWIWKNVPSWEGEKWESLLEVSTARECCYMLCADAHAEVSEFVGLYEKARYGKGLCAPRDVQRMKELAEILHKKV